MARRLSIDLTDDAEAEIERLKELSGKTTAELFRQALDLLRKYYSGAENRDG